MIKKFLPIYLGVFFVSLHYATVLYINSSFLETFFLASTVGLLYIVGGGAGALLLIYMPRLLSLFGAKMLFFVFLCLEALAILMLILTTSPLSASVGFILFASFSLLIYYVLDIFLEDLSSDDHTGEIRGSYLTIGNLGIVLAPMLVAALLVENNFSIVYKASLLFILPLFIIGFFLAKRVEKRPHQHPHTLPWGEWWSRGDVRRITLARFVLEFFFAVMVIYTPIYLHGILGFEWQAIGVMFSIMLLPFVLFQWPVGELSDHFFGEKEFLIAGFILIICTLLLMPSLSPVFWVWALVLFLSRVGASFVEITTESYFFKQISSADIGLVSIFRLTRPLSIACGAGFGALSVKLLPFPAVFILTALVVSWGLYQTLFIKDTKDYKKNLNQYTQSKM